MSAPTLPTVKTHIINEIKRTLIGIPDIGEALSIDSAALEQGSRDDDWRQVILKAIDRDPAGGNNFAVELDVSPDEAVHLETAGGRAFMLIDEWDFELFLLIHMPKGLIVMGETQPMLPVDCAEYITAKIAAIMGRLTPANAGEQCGQWFDLLNARASNPWALHTSVAARGGVALSDLGTRVTFLRAIVRYRTAKGDLGVVA